MSDIFDSTPMRAQPKLRVGQNLSEHISDFSALDHSDKKRLERGLSFFVVLQNFATRALFVLFVCFLSFRFVCFVCFFLVLFVYFEEFCTQRVVLST